MLLAGRFPRWWWLPAGILFTFVAFVADPRAAVGDDDRRPQAAPHEAGLAAPRRSSARRESAERRSGSRTRASARPRRTPSPWGSARPRGSSSGTRCSTAATRRGEIRVVAAHEFGHVARRHIWKGLGWYVLIELPGLLRARVADRAARRDGPARGRAVRAARDHGLPPGGDAVLERRLPPLRGRGRLARARRRRTIPRRRSSSSAASVATTSSSPTRPAGRTSGSTTTRRWRSAWRWRRRGRPGGLDDGARRRACRT